MQALVINLERSKSRIDFQNQQLKELGISFERIDAIDAANLDEGTYEAHANSWERPLRRTEVACALSHLSAWQKVHSDDQPYLVLEDDALLSSHIKLIIDALASRTDYDCVNLETRARRKTTTRKKTNLCNEFRLSGLIQDKCGAAAYVLWPSGAQSLLEWIDRNGIGLADAILALGPNWNHGQIEPAAAIQMDCCDYYGIQSPLETSTNIHNTPKPIASRTHPFLWRRLKAQARMAKRKLCTIVSAETVNLQPHGITPSGSING
jgi:glycosyl transferase family 25